MNTIQKEKITHLIHELVNGNHSEERGNEIHHELDKLIIDPKWSDYIFWSNDYFSPAGDFIAHKFFEKIQEYQLSDECQRNQYVISLVNDLLKRNFQHKSETQIVNELNNLLPNTDWIDYLFVSKICIDRNNELYEHNFINLVFG